MKYSTNQHNVVKTGIVILIAIFSACGTTPTTQSLTTETTTTQAQLPQAPGKTDLLVDNLEDGNSFNELRGTWFTYNDNDTKVGGDSKVIPEAGSTFIPSPGGPAGSTFTASIKGQVTTTFRYGFVGMGTNLNSSENPVDITKQGYNAIQFWAKGNNKRYRIKLRSQMTPDGDYFGYDFQVTPEWKRYVVTFQELKQGGGGIEVNKDQALSKVISINWQTIGQPHTSIELSVDNISFIQKYSNPK